MLEIQKRIAEHYQAFEIILSFITFLAFALPSMAAVCVFPGAMVSILNRDSCLAKVSVVMYGMPW